MGEMGRMYAKYLSQAGWKRRVVINYSVSRRFLTI